MRGQEADLSSLRIRNNLFAWQEVPLDFGAGVGVLGGFENNWVIGGATDYWGRPWFGASNYQTRAAEELSGPGAEPPLPVSGPGK